MYREEPIEGFAFRLRAVQEADAAFILELRTSERARFLHPVDPDLEAQRRWIRDQRARPGDYYFLIERRADRRPEGTIGLCGITAGEAEWGRWILRPDSLAALESVWMLCCWAFEALGLESLYSLTLVENRTVLSLHEALGFERVRLHRGRFHFSGVAHDAVEHRIWRARWERDLEPRLRAHCLSIARRMEAVCSDLIT
jgi:RimJ/RimL family protein N-acetyltransferase|nr:MAG: hypothetical protein KatS3mg041_2005 [Bacteroidota bacterium]